MEADDFAALMPLSLAYSESYSEYNRRIFYELELAGVPKAYRLAARVTGTVIRRADRSLFADTEAGCKLLSTWDKALEGYFSRHPEERTEHEPRAIDSADALFPPSVFGYKEPDRVVVAIAPASAAIEIPENLRDDAEPLRAGSVGTVVGIRHLFGEPGALLAALKIDGSNFLWELPNVGLQRLS